MTYRLAAAAVVIAVCLALHLLIVRHLEAAGPLQDVRLEQPLAELPTHLGGWIGVDREVTDENQKFGDDYVQRVYALPGTESVALVWLVYAADGEDRGHHPEICMAVAGKRENPEARETIELPGHEAPVQQYHFGAGAESQWVFYWYYTLNQTPDEEISELQRIYQRMRRRPSSLTLEVFAPGGTDLESLHKFLAELDASVQNFLGPHAERGSHRSPVIVIDGAEAPAAAEAGDTGAQDQTQP